MVMKEDAEKFKTNKYSFYFKNIFCKLQCKKSSLETQNGQETQ